MTETKKNKISLKTDEWRSRRCKVTRRVQQGEVVATQKPGSWRRPARCRDSQVSCRWFCRWCLDKYVSRPAVSPLRSSSRRNPASSSHLQRS